jgi:hypothetical protein
MDAFVCNIICKSWACFVLGQASDLKEQLWDKSQVSLTMQGIKYKLRGENHTQSCKPVHHRHRTSKTDVAVFINFEDLVRHVQGRES